VLSGTFLAYAWLGPYLPGWLFPHRGYGVDRIVSQTFLHSQGVFGTALHVMFVYVFLFVLFGAVLGETGATRFVVDFARRAFGTSAGAPAKVAVLSSGMMGSLSGSAVANVATTGVFTIPMMKSAGFRAEVAGGVEAAASSGGALVPPVMGAGAYMMLEIIDPPVTYLEIVRAAILPAALYYFSLLLIVHFYARKIGNVPARAADAGPRQPLGAEAVVFGAGIGTLLAFLLAGFTVFRAATLALGAVVLAAAFHPRTRLTLHKALAAVSGAARDAVPLVTAAACVGIVIGVVTLTGVGTRLPASVLALAQDDLLAALAVIMASTIVLGMGLPSAVCYLLMATLIGPVLGKLGVVPLAAHLFIFYFGMMSMVTPPVALAGYAAASIAGAGIMRTGMAAFRFALVGFTLPFMFVFRPQLLMLDESGAPAAWPAIALAVALAAAGIVAFAGAISGQLVGAIGLPGRAVLGVSAALLLVPVGSLRLLGLRVSVLDLVGALLLAGVAWVGWRRAPADAHARSAGGAA
jgi:TRAP transporter 4TM/12TM fusion protein